MNKGKELILKTLGFTKEGQRHFHKISQLCRFDFSSNSIEGIVCTIFDSGFKLGKDYTQAQIKEALGIKVDEEVKP